MNLSIAPYMQRTPFQGGALLVAMLLLAAPFCATTSQAARMPAIRHSPIHDAPRGQSVTIRARVTPGQAPIEEVNLYFAVSADATPFKIAMVPTEGQAYSGVIPAHFIETHDRFSYYLDATDKEGYLAETDWHQVTLADLEPTTPRARPATAPEPTDERSGWGKPALIAGAAVAVGGGAAFAVSRSGSSSSKDDPKPSDEIIGTYVGAATSCVAISGTTRCDSYNIALIVQEDGHVISDTLQPGSFLRTRLDGRDFLFSVAVNDEGLTGTREFRGSVLEGRIVGDISGQGEQNGDPATFSGFFNANR